MIYLSTGGFKNETFKDVSMKLNSDIVKGIELSGGAYTNSLVDDLNSVSHNFTIALHNYFPVPKEPFVFNLASDNNAIQKRSVAHAQEAIELSAMVKAPYYSFHAGYLLDPEVNELGKKIKLKKVINRKKGLKNFIANVNYLAKFASDKGVKLLIENNVLSLENYKSFNYNPLLMVDKNETEQIFNGTDSNVNLLIDVAHLKVSANSLEFDPEEYLKIFSGVTEAYHLSDNDGTADTNNPFTANSWFVPHIKKDVKYYSIEVYNENIEKLESLYQLVQSWVVEKYA